MTVYLDAVVGLNFLVDFLLLVGSNYLAGYPGNPGRAALAAAVGGIYGGACLLPGFAFLGSTLWRFVSLGLMSVIAFGFGTGSRRRCVLFVLLSMALGGVALGLGSGGFAALAAAAAAVCLLCLLGFRGNAAPKRLVPVELSREGREVRLMALHDTGNTLRDPLTGEQVMVAGAEAAMELLGLDRDALADPVATAAKGKVPGLRLIPYRAVGQSGGMLLGVRVPEARIGGKRRSMVVAFAPDGLGGDEYGALIGGLG